MEKKSVSFLFTFLPFLTLLTPSLSYFNLSAHKSDEHLLEFPLNLEYLEAEFFLWGSLGYGLDKVDPHLSSGGPPPIGVTKANFQDPVIKDIMVQFAFQEVGHLRAIKDAVRGFPRPLMDLSASSFAKVMDKALGRTLMPPFDPYANDINFLLASYLIPYVGLTGYVGSSPKLKHYSSKRLTAGLLSVESAQDAIIRGLLYERLKEKVQPYGETVAEITNRLSNLRNNLGRSGIKDEGLWVPVEEGAEGETQGNVVAGDKNSVAYDRTPKEILRIVYGGGDEHVPGGFYPKGALGHIAKSYLNAAKSYLGPLPPK